MLRLVVAALIGLASGNLRGPLTPDFQSWLSAHGYDPQDFTRPDFQADSQFWASYGGKTTPSDSTATPVIFVHGNSDSALANPNAAQKAFATGWDASINYFRSRGYGSGQLYATTWGPADSSKASGQIHACSYLLQLRKFVEAVLGYTGAAAVDIISHSMGVTLSRRVILGGSLTDSNGEQCDLGSPLTDKVDTFIGISGANHGLCSCSGTMPLVARTCNYKDGFYPGSCSFFAQNCVFNICKPTNYAAYLANLNAASQSNEFEGKFRYFIYSLADDVILNADNCYGHPTSGFGSPLPAHSSSALDLSFPGATGGKVFDFYTHMGSKDKTPETQFTAVTAHTI